LPYHEDAERKSEPNEANQKPSTSSGAAAEEGPDSSRSDATAEKLKALQAEKDELFNTLVRRQADFENYRKRIDRERHQDRHRAVEGLIEKLLPALDAFDRALEADKDAAYQEHRKGFELIYKQLRDVLAKQGLERIDATGQEFNPHLHHAIERVETTETADGMVESVLQAGYKLHDKVLRPAMVRVAVNPASAVTDLASKKH
jgi:molecular chaperone GrpE